MFRETVILSKRFGLILFFLIINFNKSFPQTSDNYQVGKQLFTDHCSKCHQINRELIGPALRDISEKRDINWLYEFIRNSQKMIEEGDSLAISLYNQYEQVEMPAVDLTNEEIDKILKYIEVESKKEVAIVSNPPPAPSSTSNYIIQYISGIFLLTIFIFLVIVMIFGENGTLNRIYRLLFLHVSKSIYIFFMIALSVIWLLSYQKKDSDIVQAVFFSHEQHYSIYDISCVYCHQNAKRGKTANIPEAHVCMKCHEYIEDGEFYGKKEIRKLYDQVDHHEEITWNKGFRFGGFVKFDHSLHTINNRFDCIECHTNPNDPIIRSTDFTMKWCIDCHDLNFVDMENPYYSNLEDQTKMNLTSTGGKDCIKCHY